MIEMSRLPCSEGTVFIVPEARNERVDWHALDADDQAEVTAYRAHRLDMAKCSIRTRVFLRRHCGAI